MFRTRREAWRVKDIWAMSQYADEGTTHANDGEADVRPAHSRRRMSRTERLALAPLHTTNSTVVMDKQ